MPTAATCSSAGKPTSSRLTSPSQPRACSPSTRSPSTPAQDCLAPGVLTSVYKVRRDVFEPVDLFHAHIGGMDAFAHGLKIAAKIRADGVLRDFVKKRYSSWDTGIGQKIES